ncbi:MULTISPECIES: cyclic nucleotide-binding domain-containing protein [Synechococcales]|uniref:cyclic nucleotide-binding domain-containing protein n=1 Tax=Synechococcus sp. CS-1324 TaxID=2847980 RepID=UPI00223B19F8|nr:cyclic nucleotide-binding domain-containing protein [Synechococcus sp. CS-1324]
MAAELALVSSIQLIALLAMTNSALMDKVLVLSGVDIFSDAPDPVLVQLANGVEEVHLQPGDVLFRQGDLGTSMYVIVSGLVRVHIGDQTVVELGEREIVGELAALDPEPRSASVSALEPTLLYRIDQEMLAALMVDHPEIVRGVIRELAKRLRSTTAVYEPI